MNKYLTAIAFMLSLPAIAHAQAASAPAEKPGCCEKMKAEGKKCCCDKSGADSSKHDSQGTDKHQH
jgi:hypothetical protein